MRLSKVEPASAEAQETISFKSRKHGRAYVDRWHVSYRFRSLAANSSASWKAQFSISHHRTFLGTRIDAILSNKKRWGRRNSGFHLWSHFFSRQIMFHGPANGGRMKTGVFRPIWSIITILFDTIVLLDFIWEHVIQYIVDIIAMWLIMSGLTRRQLSSSPRRLESLRGPQKSTNMIIHATRSLPTPLLTVI